MTERAESVAGNWLIEQGKRAEVRLQAMDPTTLGPAGKLLLGIRKQTCPTCSGKGYVEVTQIDGSMHPAACGPRCRSQHTDDHSQCEHIDGTDPGEGGECLSAEGALKRVTAPSPPGTPLDRAATMADLQFLAMNIVNQLFDLAEVPVEKRQAINDDADAFVYRLLVDGKCANCAARDPQDAEAIMRLVARQRSLNLYQDKRLSKGSAPTRETGQEQDHIQEQEKVHPEGKVPWDGESLRNSS